MTSRTPGALGIITEAWEEFSDIEQTPAGVQLMGAIAWGDWNLDEVAGAVPWFDRLLPIAERLGLLEATANGILGRGSSPLVMGRPREGMVLLRGAHQFAVANDLHDPRYSPVFLTWYERSGDPVAGLALAREGLEIARRRGSRLYGSWMVGNGCICALRTGDWDWAAGLLEEWLALESADIRLGRVPRGPRDPPLAPGRGRGGGPRGGGPDPASRPGSPARSSRPTSCGPGRGPRSPPAVSTRSAGSGSARSR